MGYKEGFLDYSNGVKIRYRIDDHLNRPIVVFLHGVSTNLDFYKYMNPYFDNNGLSLNSLEIRGTGESNGDILRSKEIDVVMKDLKRLIYGNLKNSSIYLMGVSFGALIGALTTFDERFKIKGLILLSPPFFLKISIIKKFAIHMAGIFLSRFRLKVNRDYFDKTTSDREYSELIYQEVLKKGNVTFGFISKLLFLIKKFKKSAYLLKKIPCLLITGDKDSLIDLEKTLNFMKHIYNDVDNLTLLGLKNCSHSILLEKERIDNLYKIIDWIHSIEIKTPFK